MSEDREPRRVSLSVEVPSDADLLRVMETLARTGAGLILEGLEASIYSFEGELR
ncbi:hypothetical protein JL108_14415 [Aeromicrobium sp. YIM 150415]|uniref:hypothetical protein n=1 Tax=Aeromicrobium sp. YIM 150415 TaxID=2803912 RepID=UPI001962B28C|nr:hypothetical protein [Aeromicrobium sp. YIM 150415]MBM9464647.1 hypothetical protein [Aeromicrobium sp. YIM 150415]